MLIWITISTILGLIGSTVNDAASGVFVGSVIFAVGLPGILVAWLIFGIASIGQDRTDAKQIMADFNANFRANRY